MGCNFLLVLSIDLGKYHVRMLLGHLFIGRRKRTAGTAPGRPEINDNEIVVVDGIFEIFFIQFNNRHNGLQ